MKDNFEKIKDFLIEYKKYVAIAIIIIIALFAFKTNNPSSKNDSGLGMTETQKEVKKKQSISVSTSSENKQSEEPENVTCDISGAVKHQGVYTLKNGARLQELIEAAGGLAQNAQIKAINRAIQLKDQDKIHIPYKGEKVESATTISQNQDLNSKTDSSKNNSGTSNSEKINLNTATAADLQKLNGIGEKRAQQIVDYREQNGKFKKIEDLMQVSGIGEKTFAALKDQLAI